MTETARAALARQYGEIATVAVKKSCVTSHNSTEAIPADRSRWQSLGEIDVDVLLERIEAAP